MAASRIKPVLLVDEVQEMEPGVLNELRILSSAEFDATSLLTVVLAGDGRLPDGLRQEDLVPLGTRIRTRLVMEPASSDELRELLTHALAKAGSPLELWAAVHELPLHQAAVDLCRVLGHDVPWVHRW